MLTPEQVAEAKRVLQGTADGLTDAKEMRWPSHMGQMESQFHATVEKDVASMSLAQEALDAYGRVMEVLKEYDKFTSSTWLRADVVADKLRCALKKAQGPDEDVERVQSRKTSFP